MMKKDVIGDCKSDKLTDTKSSDSVVGYKPAPRRARPCHDTETALFSSSFKELEIARELLVCSAQLL